MSLLNALTAEGRKATALPAVMIAAGAAAMGSVAVTWLNMADVARDHSLASASAATEAVFAAVPVVTIGTIVVGVTVISSEYSSNSPDAGGGRQISTTLTATPMRGIVMVAKVVVAALLMAGLTAACVAGCLFLAHCLAGTSTMTSPGSDLWARSLGCVCYATLTGLLALGVTVLTRSGTLPLIILIMNSSLVSVSFLLSRVTPLAYWLPDLAGARLFARDTDGLLNGALAPIPGGLVMAAWTAGLLLVAALVFERRDA